MGLPRQIPGPTRCQGERGGSLSLSRGRAGAAAASEAASFKALLQKHAETEARAGGRKGSAPPPLLATAGDRSGFCGNGGGGLPEPYGALKTQAPPIQFGFGQPRRRPRDSSLKRGSSFFCCSGASEDQP